MKVLFFGKYTVKKTAIYGILDCMVHLEMILATTFLYGE